MLQTMKGWRVVMATLLLVAAGCGTSEHSSDSPPEAAAAAALPRDVHSYARPDEVAVTHMELEWRVLFDRRILEGSVLHHLKLGPRGQGQPLRLDTRDLDVSGVTAGKSGALADAPWKLGERDANLGSELVVQLPEGADRVRIEYRTRPEASGLQWLDPQQTAGGVHPFLYSQSQAIHARSWIPCQDSPGIRTTFEASIQVEPPLRAVMAANEAARADSGLYRYSMPHPIPAYLLALAAGDLAFEPVGPRTGVWTEPALLKKAAWEFADMERMLQATETMYGPYRWGRYDVLVLPPSFPFGGMENPMLTFATPTILAGDRSLVALVAHELAHSWSGNLVTNATWADFWLNEGFTTYLERRIMETVYGRERAEMEWTLGRHDLEKEIAETLADKPGDQKLRIDLAGRDPDDGTTDVPYEKGALLLRRLEEAYGREAFDPFLRSWFDEHAFTSVTTDVFLAFLDERLVKKSSLLPGASVPDLRAWIDGPGLPQDAPRSESPALAKVAEAAALWASGKALAAKLDTSGWTTHHWLHFLRALPPQLTKDQMKALDSAFRFTATGNSEILDEWLVLAVRHGHAAGDARLEEFLTRQGRRKYLTPLYKELVKTEAGKARAKEIYAKARPLYHAISRRTLDEIVGWP